MAFKRKNIQLLTNQCFLDINVTTIAPICFYGNVSFEITVSVFKQ